MGFVVNTKKFKDFQYQSFVVIHIPTDTFIGISFGFAEAKNIITRAILSEKFTDNFLDYKIVETWTSTTSKTDHSYSEYIEEL